MDDVLIHGTNQQEHDTRLIAALQRIQAGVTLNYGKCKFNKTSLVFLGHLIDGRGIQADPNKTAAIRNMDTPRNVSELRRFLGMANQISLVRISQTLHSPCELS